MLDQTSRLLVRSRARSQCCPVLPPSPLQQAFNATAVVRHMRRLQLGSSMGSSMDASNPPSRQNQAQKMLPAGSNQPAQSQNAVQAAQSQSGSTAASKTSSSSIDNNIAAPRKDCEYRRGESVAPEG